MAEVAAGNQQASCRELVFGAGVVVTDQRHEHVNSGLLGLRERIGHLGPPAPSQRQRPPGGAWVSSSACRLRNQPYKCLNPLDDLLVVRETTDRRLELPADGVGGLTELPRLGLPDRAFGGQGLFEPL